MSELEEEVPGSIVCITMLDSEGNEVPHVDGAKISVCSECLIEIWVAPTSFKVLEDYPDTPLWCINCAREKLQDPDNTFMTAPGAPEELDVDPQTLDKMTQEVKKIFLEKE